jgi:hypothetical protein
MSKRINSVSDRFGDPQVSSGHAVDRRVVTLAEM